MIPPANRDFLRGIAATEARLLTGARFRLRAGGDERALFLLKRFLEPRGKNLPCLSRGRLLASFFPLATRFDDFLLRLRFGGIRTHVKGLF